MSTRTALAALPDLPRRVLPGRLMRQAKRLAVHPRYWLQCRRCRRGFRVYGDRYPRHVLFIAGLPKSGTSWLESMVASFPGYGPLLAPDVTRYEFARGASHDYDLPEHLFDRFRNMLVLTKMHVHGSPHNARVLHDAGVRYVVLYRDLRDVAVSHYYYVRRTPWHPEYDTYRQISVQEALALFGVRTLPGYVEWVRSWRQNRDPDMSIELRYEDLVADPSASLARVADLFDLPRSPDTIASIVREHRFERLSGGRHSGRHSDHSFYRKGTPGDWRSHFPPPLRALYKSVIGEFLIDFGYERGLGW